MTVRCPWWSRHRPNAGCRFLEPGAYRVRRWPVLSNLRNGGSNEPREREIRERAGDQGLHARFGPVRTLFRTEDPGTVHEAPCILDGLLKNEVGRRVREQYADMGGFADHVFAACAILGYALVSRIRDLPSKRLYVLDRASVPGQLRPLIGGMIDTGLIERNWPDILRLAATMTAGTVAPSLIPRKLATFPRQNELATALSEVGRVERSIFMVNWIMDPDLRRRAQVGLNKGEAHHAPKLSVATERRGILAICRAFA